MRRLLSGLLVLGVLGGAVHAETDSPLLNITALMPPHPTHENDSYICTVVKAPEEAMHLVGFTPEAHQSTVHHMLLFGCRTPARTDLPVWDCKMKKVCAVADNENVLYGWGKNAPAVTLPEGTGFAVGPGSAIRSFVLQVHYRLPRPAHDASGLRMQFSRQATPRSAGMLAYAARFTIPPRQHSHLVPNSCCYSGFEPMRGIAARVHTHTMGRSVFLERRGPEPGAAWSQVFSQDPQQPQGFYPLTQNLTILPGDSLRATCLFNSSQASAPVSAGHGSENEMCNLYLLVDAHVPAFQWCADSSSYVAASPPGALPVGAEAVAEEAHWRPPADVGQGAGVAADGRGRVYAFGRVGRVWDADAFDPATHLLRRGDVPIPGAPLAILDADSGAASAPGWGAGAFLMPHGASLAPDGTLWLTDVGAHQALQFTPEGARLGALGERGVPGDGTGAALCQPTHVAVSRDGTVYVTDGYCAARVAVFSKSGAFLRSLALPAPARLRVPHSLVLDECSGAVHVADREAGAVHALDALSGALRGTWSTRQYGLPYALALGPYGAVHVLAWDREGPGAATWLLALAAAPGRVAAAWRLPGLRAPHDFALLPLPLAVTLPGERSLGVVVVEAAAEGSRLVKFAFRAAPDNGTEPVVHDARPLPTALEVASHSGAAAGHAQGTDADGMIIIPLAVAQPPVRGANGTAGADPSERRRDNPFLKRSEPQRDGIVLLPDQAAAGVDKPVMVTAQAARDRGGFEADAEEQGAEVADAKTQAAGVDPVALAHSTTGAQRAASWLALPPAPALGGGSLLAFIAGASIAVVGVLGWQSGCWGAAFRRRSSSPRRYVAV
uniref:Peptidylglycine monooxygenase n=1 Tax=Auxenochlorella protothecoides TaxID=3075 RepID=A0A1D1ZR72_AUXPR